MQLCLKNSGRTGSAIIKGREPRICLGRVFNIKLGSFTDNTKIVQHANGQGFVFLALVCPWVEHLPP
jgi:hypothetical protein